MEPDVDMEMEFVLYRDPKGVGAADCELFANPPEVGMNAVKEEDDSLPTGWKKVWSEEHEEWYFWNRSTKESRWTRPQDAEQEEEPELPEGWEKVLDVERGLWYYWHRATKTSTWDRPETPTHEGLEEKKPDDSAGVLQARVLGEVAEWRGVFGWIAVSGNAKSSHPLLSNGDSKVFVNWRDVQGDQMLSVGDRVDFLVSSDDGGLRALDVHVQESAESAGAAISSKRLAPPLKVLQSHWEEEDDAPGGEEEEKPDSDAPLLPGWEQHWSEEHSCVYYWHKATKQSSWERPALPVQGGAEPQVAPITPGANQARAPDTPSHQCQGAMPGRPKGPLMRPQLPTRKPPWMP